MASNCGEDNIHCTDIIMPVYNQASYTHECLGSIAAHTPSVYRVIVVDNGSSDETPSLLADCREQGLPVEVITNTTNLGFTQAANQGLRLADASHVVLLNNDTVVTEGWLSGLLLTADSDETIGLVGPRILDPRTDLIRCIGGLVFHTTRVEAPPGQGCAKDDPRFAESFDCQYVEGSCMLIKRHVLEVIGYLDEIFSPGYYEDVDYCFRAREAGFRVVYSPHSEIYHHVNVTANAMRREGPSLSQAACRNDRIFRERWGHRFWP